MSNAGTITSLSNSGAISGGTGGYSRSHGGFGGAGVLTLEAITSLTNGGAISGGNGGGSTSHGGTGGAGVSNAGTIGKLSNSGKIDGGSGGGAFAGSERRRRRGRVERRRDRDAAQ